jgi:hypothetical protein
MAGVWKRRVGLLLGLGLFERCKLSRVLLRARVKIRSGFRRAFKDVRSDTTLF